MKINGLTGRFSGQCLAEFGAHRIPALYGTGFASILYRAGHRTSQGKCKVNGGFRVNGAGCLKTSNGVGRNRYH